MSLLSRLVRLLQGGPPRGWLLVGLVVGVTSTDVRAVGRLDNGLGINNDEQGTTIYACSGPRESWPRLWPLFVHLG
ncbi:MAG: phospholipid carrier-dependent glycosyltransferase [Marmoricola sp.]|nr:phospholipid carrier-dependent glycosyltransferase [Marmoricola sp.]